MRHSHQIRSHGAILIALAMLLLISFIPGQITGSTVFNFNASETNASIVSTGSSIENTSITTEIATASVNITNTSCSWDGSNFTVCETIEWYNGSYAKGYISGTTAVAQIEKQFNNTFTYCQLTDSEGTKALHAYVYDENNNQIARDIDNKVRCEKLNITNETVEETNVSVDITENITTETVNNTNETLSNVSTTANITEITNITNITENASVTNISIENITINETSQNITNITEISNITNATVINISVENATANVSILEEKLIQYQAVIGQPVKWKKIIKLENETANLEIDLPKDANIISIKEIENNQTIDITSDVINPSSNNLITGLAILEEPNSTSVIIEKNVTEVEIEYETEAPQVYEEYVEGVKRIIVSSNTHYENILTFTSINDTQQDRIRLYWIVNGSRVSHQIINYSDTNNNGLVDEVYWITPSLSNQTFELEIIEVSRALHLDSSYNFISDVYPNVSVWDNVWTEPIYNNEYLRITFERNLTSNNDITVYARNTQNTSTKIEVYHFNSTTKIIEFPVINSTGYYKILLTGMNGSTDIFDLKIVDNISNNSYLEFDYIVDPGGATACGDISTSTTLTTNVSDVGTCYNITANNVVLDCAGYGITYGTVNTGDGVTAISRDNITVQNCFILDNNSTNARGVGVNFSSVTNSLIYNNTIDTNGTSNNDGIKLFSSSTNRVTNNTIRTLGSSTDNYGINVVSGSRDNNISGNTIYANGSSDNYGIRISTDSDRNVANENTIATTGTSNNNFGIYLVTRVTFNNVTNNVINTSGTAVGSGAGYGINLQSSANNTLVLNNTIITGVRTNNPSNVGLRAVTKSFFNNFTHNRVNTSGTANNYGVELTNNADISVVEYNNISASGNSNTNYGIVQTTSTGNNITNNNISTGRSANNEGIRLATDSNRTTIDRNNITTSGTGISNFGISLITRVARVNITNNVINTSGTTTNHGINIDTDSNNNLVLNNTINYGGSASGNRGILLTTGSFLNNITHNRITGKGGTSGNSGIELTTNANYSTIEYNNISTNGTTTTNYGIAITSSTSNNITNNVIFTNGSSSNEGIRIVTNSNNTIVNSNNITTTGTAGSNFGISFITTVVVINVTNNIINTSGTTTNYGVSLSTDSDNSTIDRNNITAGGSSTANHGIYLVLNSTNNNITNNVINASGSGTIYGLAVENITEANSMNRFDSNNISVSSAGSFGVFIRAANDTIFNNTYIRNVPNWTSSLRANNNNTFENTTFANINGTINFAGTFHLNGTREITLALLNTTYNRSFVNSSNLTFLNTTATIRLYIPGLNDPRVLLDTEDDGTYRGCPASRCTETSYSASVFTFNVTSWTSHAGADNQAPTITRVDINSTDPTTNNTNTNITIYVRNVSDLDSDQVQNISNWFVNGASLTILNMPFESNITSNASRTIRDYTGLNNGTLGQAENNIPNWTNTSLCRRGGCYSFEGEDVINISSPNATNFTSNSNWTVTLWFNGTDPSTILGDVRTMIRLGNGTTNSWLIEYGLRIVGGNVNATRFTIVGNGSGSGVVTTPSQSALPRSLHFLVARFESLNGTPENTTANISIWLNGRTSVSAITTVNLTPVVEPQLLIGEITGTVFIGMMDEVLIFNRSLSAEEILYLNGSNGAWETIVAQETGSAGENWSACVTPNDIITDGASVCSANFSVIGPPSNITLINPPNATNNRSNIHKFIANITDDSGLDNATLYHNISGTFVANQTVSLNGTNNQTNFTVNLITDGGYTWYVLSCDTANNCNQSSVNFTFTVDSSRPSAVNLTNPPDTTNNRSTSHIFESNASDSYSGLTNATLYHNISGSWLANQTTTVSGTNQVRTMINVSSIADGRYIWNVQWCDAAGNCNQSTSNFTFTVDATRPSSVNLSSPGNATVNTSRSWSFESNASDALELVNATLYHNISGSWLANQTVTVTGTNGVVTRINVSNVADGGYIWNVQWCDAAGNCNQSSSNFTFTVNNPPSGVNLTTPLNATINSSRTWLFESNASDVRGLVNATLYHNISGTFVANQTVTVTGTNGVRTQINISNVADGGYSWNVLWCDGDSNCTFATSNSTLTVNQEPNITLNRPLNATINTSRTWLFNSNYSDSRGLANATLYHNISGSWTANQTSTIDGTENSTNFTVSSVVDGGYVWNVLACDVDSNCSFADTNFTFTVNNFPSGINLTNPPNGTANASTSHVFFSNASDARQLANATLYHNISGDFAANETVTRNGTTNTSSFTVSSISIGQYIWNVLWCDTDSNCTFATSNFTFNVTEPSPQPGSSGVGPTGPVRTASIVTPKPKPVPLPARVTEIIEESEVPKPRFKIELPKEVLTRTISLQIPLKPRAIDWTVILAIAIIVALALIRKELQYLKEYKERLALEKAKQHEYLPQPERLDTLAKDIWNTLVRSIKIFTLSLDTIFHTLTYIVTAIKNRRLRVIKLAALTKAHYARSLEKAKHKLIEKAIAEEKLLSLEKLKKARFARLSAIRYRHLEIKNLLESIKSRLLTKETLTEKELTSLEASFIKPLPVIPELLARPEVKEVSEYENDLRTFSYLSEKINDYLKSKRLLEASGVYNALLKVYNKLVKEASDPHAIVAAAKEIQSRLKIAILLEQAKQKITPYKPIKVETELERLPPTKKYDYSIPPTQEELQLDYLHRLLKNNEYKKALEMYKSIYPDYKKEPILWPTKIKDVKIERLKPHKHVKETELPKQIEDLRLSYLRELLRKNEYKEDLKIYENIYKEKRKPIKKPLKIADVPIELIQLHKYSKEYPLPTREELIIDYIHRLLKNNEYRKALQLYDQLYGEKRKPIKSPPKLPEIAIKDIGTKEYEKVSAHLPKMNDLRELLKNNDYKAARQLLSKKLK